MRAVLAVFFVLGAAAGACSLGLDASKIPGPGDGGGDVVAVDAAGTDAPNPVGCKMDPDCKPNDKCLTGKCTMGQCVYTLCPAASCNASVCDTMSQMCSAPAAYGFHAGSFKVVQGNIGCGGSASRCFAAIFPFVFIGTTNGVVAYSVADPTTTSPAPIPVAGLPFFPSFIVASGPTIYFIGAVVGTGPSFYVPVASLTVPTDPTVGEMGATTVFDTIAYPSIDAVFPDAAGGVYLLRNDSSKSFPAAHVTAPLSDLATLAFAPAPGVAIGAQIAAASGSRLVTFRQQNGGLFDSFFSLETQAATASAQNAGEQSMIATAGQTYSPSYLAQGPNGGLLWSTDTVTYPDGGPLTFVGARVAWVLDDGNATSFSAMTNVNVNTYATNLTNDLAGPVAWVDSNTAITVSAAPSNMTQSVVQVASRNGPPSVETNKSFQLSWHPSQVAVVASSTFGYVLTPDPMPNTIDVHVFDTACNN